MAELVDALDLGSSGEKPWGFKSLYSQGLSMLVYIETLGCQMNELDSELIKQQLKKRLYGFTSKAEEADIILINTCSVRELSEQKALSRLGYFRTLKELNNNLIIGVIGCMAERRKEAIFSNYPYINLLVGPSKIYEIPILLDNLVNDRYLKQVALGDKNLGGHELKLGQIDIERATNCDNKKKMYVRITSGCNKFCSYCIIPRTRGLEVYRNEKSILQEVSDLVSQGVIEITLLGQTVNHYPNFYSLLKKIHDYNQNLKRLRFMTNYPRDISDELLDVMASSSRICKYLHVPIQSGSNMVLKNMNRGYTRESYLDLIRKARFKMPGISIVGDMIVGFPGETDKDFEESMSLVEEVKYRQLYIFKYSARPDTVSFRKMIDDVSLDDKQSRHSRLSVLQQKISLDYLQLQLGKSVQVFVEGAVNSKKYISNRLIGRTDGNDTVLFRGSRDLIGKIVHVRVNYANSYILGGNLE